MKIALYSPYLDTAGGGEKYILTIGESFIQTEQVDILLDKHLAGLELDKIKQRIEVLHGIKLSKFNFIEAPIGAGSNIFKRSLFLRQYDVIFYLSDGSFFYSTAKNNYIHFQMPLKIKTSNIWQKIKLLSWQKALYNSQFTKSFYDHLISISGEVIYPPISIEEFKPLTKKNQILTVGRFFCFGNPKKQDIMIEAFIQLIKQKKLKGWSFHLAGGAGPGDEEFLTRLKAMAKGFPIYFYPNLSLEALTQLYGHCSIYWHAAGFSETDPQKFEHFGITTVEAMAAGCVPVVINKGGQKEIVFENETGRLWNNLEELIENTYNLIKNPKQLERISENARIKANDFSEDNFKKAIHRLVYK